MRRLLTLALMLATIPVAQTDSPDSRATAVRLVEVLNWRGIMEPVRAELLARAKTNVRQRMGEELGNPTTEEYAEVERMLDQLASKYTLDDTIADIVPLLQAHYSTAEMEQLATFFSSPVYRKFQAELPEINREALETMNRKMQPAIQETVKRVFLRIDEMKKLRPSN